MTRLVLGAGCMALCVAACGSDPAASATPDGGGTSADTIGLPDTGAGTDAGGLTDASAPDPDAARSALVAHLPAVVVLLADGFADYRTTHPGAPKRFGKADDPGFVVPCPAGGQIVVALDGTATSEGCQLAAGVSVEGTLAVGLLVEEDGCTTVTASGELTLRVGTATFPVSVEALTATVCDGVACGTVTASLAGGASLGTLPFGEGCETETPDAMTVDVPDVGVGHDGADPLPDVATSGAEPLAWTHTAADLGHLHTQHCAVAAGGRIALAGGYQSVQKVATDQVSVFDTATSTWGTSLEGTAPAFPTPRRFMACVSDGLVGWFTGGQTEGPDAGLSTQVWSYSPGDGAYGSFGIAPLALSEARNRVAAAVCQGRLVVAGGETYAAGPAKSAVVDVLDLSFMGGPSQVALSVPRSRLAAAVIGSRVVLAGGRTGVSPTETASTAVDIYDCDTGTITAGPAMPHAWGAMAQPAVVGGRAWFTGEGAFAADGAGLQGAMTAGVIDVYDAATDSWSTVTVPTPRTDMGLGAVVGCGGCAGSGSLVFAAGGYVPGDGDNATFAEALDPDTGTFWSLSFSPNTATQLFVVDKSVYFLGFGMYGTTLDVFEVP